jgi:hypothetical protein
VEVAGWLSFPIYPDFVLYRFLLWKEPILRLMRRMGSSTICVFSMDKTVFQENISMKADKFYKSEKFQRSVA